MRIRDFKKVLLVAMLNYQRKNGLNRYFEPREAAESYGLAYETGQIRLSVSEFKNQGLINGAFTMGGGEDGGLSSMLTAAGIEAAEEIEDSSPELLSSARSIPPFEKPKDEGSSPEFPLSDRYIQPVGKLREIEALKSQIGELKQLIHDNRDNDFADKEGRLAEIAALELLIGQPQISVPLVEKILRETVFYLTQKFADKAIGVAAGIILGLAASAFGIKVPH